MLTATHWLIEAGCVGIIVAGAVLVAAGFATMRDAEAMLTRHRDRAAVERAYEAGGWDYPRTDTPTYDATVAAQVDLALWELSRDLDAFEDGQR